MTFTVLATARQLSGETLFTETRNFCNGKGSKPPLCSLNSEYRCETTYFG